MGFKVQGLGFRVWRLGFRVPFFKCALVPKLVHDLPRLRVQELGWAEACGVSFLRFPQLAKG